MQCDAAQVLTAPKPISSPSVPVPLSVSVGWVGSGGSGGSSPIRHVSTGSPTSALSGSQLAQGRAVTSPRRMVSSRTAQRPNQNAAANGFQTPTTCPGSGNLSTNRRPFATQPSASPPPGSLHRATLPISTSSSSKGGLKSRQNFEAQRVLTVRGADPDKRERARASPVTRMESCASVGTPQSPPRRGSQFKDLSHSKMVVEDLEGRALMLEERYRNLMRLGDALMPGRACQSATVGDLRPGRITESRISDFERRLQEVELLIMKTKPQRERAESVERRLQVLESAKTLATEEPHREGDFIMRMQAAAKEAMKAAAEAASAAEAVAAVTAGCRDRGWMTTGTDDEENDTWDSVAASSQRASSEGVSSPITWVKHPSKDPGIGKEDTPVTRCETDETDDPTPSDTPRQRSRWQLEAFEFPEVASERSDDCTEPNPKDRFGEARSALSIRGRGVRRRGHVRE